ncbi:hypothetical protein [Anabaena azotica]|uniref:hypothetical protein n=1 Tax=Anabaena azotica TaxID=197653 RepID=UPI001A7E20FC|nr:hypothetical protein [Anabaena azotica]
MTSTSQDIIISLSVFFPPPTLLPLKGYSRNQGNIEINSGECDGVTARFIAIAVSQPRAMPEITCVGLMRSKYAVAKSVNRESTAGEYPPSFVGLWPVAAIIFIADSVHQISLVCA